MSRRKNMSLYRWFICKILNEHEPSPFVKYEYYDGTVNHICKHCGAEIQEDTFGKWRKVEVRKWQ